ncbi:MAG: ribosomal protein S18-alanine N-acetyltransferase [Clostridia bacterium]|nr:ribosomal protein S18-alanine N-acetyltransferase [Clostridia bacterium]
MKILKENFQKRGIALGLCEEEDCHELFLCERECFPGDYWSENTFLENMKNPACRMVCLCDMQVPKIISYSVFYTVGDEADLANIAVLPERRKEGIGGALLDEILGIAFSDGAFRIFLEVRESNEAAIGLYRSRGFAEIGKRKRYYRNPTEDAVLMMKER